LIDYLKKQISTLKLTPDEYDIAFHIICSIDNKGYLDKSSPKEGANLYDRINYAENSKKSTTLQSYERLVVHAEILRGQFAASGRIFEFDDVMRVFKIVRALDPIGIASTSSAENMMVQLEYMAKETQSAQTKSRAMVAHRILDLHKNLLENNRLDDLCSKLKISREELREVLNLMRKLKAHPASGFNTSGNQLSNIVPDFYLENNDGRLEVRLFYTNRPNLRVKQEMLDKLTSLKIELKNAKKNPALTEERNYLDEKIKQANAFIDSLSQRFNTLSQVMRTIVEFQRDFFISGDWSDIKPMILERIAEKTGLDVSTISRVASTKYVQTEHGILSLRRFFSESIKNNEGQDVSTTAVKEIVRDLIAAETPRKPMSDDVICKELENRGLNIARRTVAKYRESMGIPVARLRKS
jgi:RNA polymerase sigma-54 factor